jgi:hypothetical protein
VITLNRERQCLDEAGKIQTREIETHRQSPDDSHGDHRQYACAASACQPVKALNSILGIPSSSLQSSISNLYPIAQRDAPAEQSAKPEHQAPRDSIFKKIASRSIDEFDGLRVSQIHQRPS